MSSYDIDTPLAGDGDDAAIGKGSSGNNAFSNKVTAILSTPFTDGELREALRLLDDRNLSNTAETRRRLALDVQREVIDCNGDVVRDFGGVAEQLRAVGTSVARLNASFEDMRRHVSAAAGEAGPMLDEVGSLMAAKREAETRKRLFDAFSAHFILSEEETQKLVSSSDGVDDTFFDLLARLRRIHEDCQVLLLGADDQKLGLELMEQSSRTLNSAFQKLYRWIEAQFKTLELENPHMSAPVRRALRALAERPTIFENCLETLAAAREKNLSDAFYAALTGAGPSSQTSDPTATKPMELYAHDAIRFTGDMLAWVHSAAVSEREALEILFVSEEGDEMARGLRAGAERSEPWLRDGVQAFDGRRALELLVNRDLAGVARGLRQRVERVIQGDDEPVLAYKLANLIDFYRITLRRLLGGGSTSTGTGSNATNSSSTMLDTLAALRESALRQYRTAMKEYISSILVDTTRPPADLGPPEFLMDALAQLEELMKSFESSLPQAPSATNPLDDGDGSTTAFEPIMAECLDPVFAICEKMAARLTVSARAIFTINCIEATKLVLAPHRFDAAVARVARLDATVADLSAQLVEFQHGFLLQSSGLQPLLGALAGLATEDEEEDLRTIPTLEPFYPQALADASQTLDYFLPSALEDARENIAALRHRQIAEDITTEAAGRFCEDFESVETRLIACDELYLRDKSGKGKTGADGEGKADEFVPLRSRYPRTSGEIRVLMS